MRNDKISCVAHYKNFYNVSKLIATNFNTRRQIYQALQRQFQKIFVEGYSAK